MTRVDNNTSIKQANFTIEDIGNVIKSTKKRITWTFQIGDEKERTIELLWSKNSGKRQITDGDFLHEETKKGNFLFFKWEKDGADLHIIASAQTPAKARGVFCENFCKFELIINGLPFSKLPRKDGTLLPPQEGPGPHGIFDIIYPQGYDVYFTKEAPIHKPKLLKKRLSGSSQTESHTESSDMMEEITPES